ncbi:MAG TPA: mechanosensitive ion channel domain-containing protein, partial [Salinimicrobium sp.]|nr:mechanosensitive ion channel domain-containing protein [Salinimicrobium sp.]
MFSTNRDFTGFLEDYFIANGMYAELAHYLSLLINIFFLFLLLFIAYYAVKKIIVLGFISFTNKTKTTFDDFLVKGNFPKYVSNILPLIILFLVVPEILEDYPRFLSIFQKLLNIYIILLTVLICRSLLRTSRNYLKTREEFMDKPMDSYIQVLMIFIWLIGFTFIFSELTGKDVLNFLISLGAASAIILLIFKDTILGFVASIQVSVNDIVRIGDWITFSKFGADGYVTEINLATVKVQNWDKTFTTIPTYSLIADSFQNWRGMQESPGRRIKHSLFIKQNSVRFVNKEDLERFKQFNIIAPYLKERQEISDKYNENLGIDRKVVINGRNQTNLGIFRKYANTYLEKHPLISKELFIMARLLAPTTQGIPLEIYCFSSEKRWAYFEEVNADIFEHLIAAIPYFDLQLFEEPSGDDIIKI